MAITSSDQAVVRVHQHQKPCGDCPFSRKAIAGWLGGSSPEKFMAIALSDARYDCHTRKADKKTFHQCAGMAIFRANICKDPRDPSVLKLEADCERVFARPREFMEYHERGNE